MQVFFKDYSEYIVLAISLLVVSPLLYWLRGKRKSLSFDIENISVVIDKEKVGEEPFSVLYNGMPVDHVEVITIKFSNNGNEPIVKDDFVKPIIISLDKGAQVLSINSSNPNIALEESKFSGNQVFILFDLLNAGDFFKIDIICNAKSSIGISSRIKGVKKITQQVKFRRHFFMMLICILLISLLTGYSAFGNVDKPIKTVIAFVVLILMFISFPLFFIQLITGNRSFNEIIKKAQ